MAVGLGDARLRPHVARTLQQLLQQGSPPVATGDDNAVAIKSALYTAVGCQQY
jgi:hypothetical protein